MVAVIMGSLAAEKGWKKGPWTHGEDRLLSDYVSLHGEGRWSSVEKFAGLNRSGKSCRLRWVNYLRPGLKKGQLNLLEEGIITELHAVLGNKWSTIAKYLPGRTDNEIKNYCRTHFKKGEKSIHKKLESRKTKVLKQVKQEDQLEQQHQENDIKSISFHLETKNETKLSETQDNKQQEMAFMYPTIDDQYSFPLIYQDFSSSWPDIAGYDSLLFSLWDLDEPQGLVDHVNQFTKYAMPNQATFGAGGVSSKLAMQNQDKTSCFDDAYNNLCCGKDMFG